MCESCLRVSRRVEHFLIVIASDSFDPRHGSLGKRNNRERIEESTKVEGVSTKICYLHNIEGTRKCVYSFV